MRERRSAPLGAWKDLEDRLEALENAVNPPINNPPEWTVTSLTVPFSTGVADTFSLVPYATDPDGDTLAYSISPETQEQLPTGISLTPSGIIEATSGTATGTTSGISIDVSDGKDTATLDITIEITGGPVWLSQPDPQFTQGIANTYDFSTLVTGETPITIDLSTETGGGAPITNEFIWSEAFDNAAWTKDAGTINADATTDPEATSLADELVADSAGGTAQVYARQSLTLPTVSTNYCWSCYCKANTLSWVVFHSTVFSGLTNINQYFNLSTGTAGTLDPTADSAGVIDVGNGWYRCYVNFTLSTDATGNLQFGLADSDGDKVVTRNGTNSIYLWGAMIEEGVTTPSDYVQSDATPGTGSAGSSTLPAGLSYSDPILTYDGVGGANTASNVVATATDNSLNETDTSPFDIVISNPAPSDPGDWPINGWAMQGGYMISNMSGQSADPTQVEHNAEKDILIAQMLGWYPGIVESYTGYYKAFKDWDSNCLILAYQSPNVMEKTDSGNASGPDWFHDLINGSNGHEDWILDGEINGNPGGYEDYAQAAFNDNYYRTNIADQFTSNNSSGRSFSEEVAYQVFTAMNVTNTNGKMIDVVDGVYWDVIHAAPELMYKNNVDPRETIEADWNDDNVADPRNDETDGLGVEANYGGCRMWRRGMANWVDSYEAQFPTGFIISRNAATDGIYYSGSNVLGSGDPMDQSEFYQKWQFGLFERLGAGLGIARRTSNSDYLIRFNGFAQQARHAARIQLQNKVTAQATGGKYGNSAVLWDYQLLNRTPTDADYNMHRAIGALCALTGGVLCAQRERSRPSPPLDEFVYDWGDTVNPFIGSDGDRHTLGTINPSVSPAGSNADFTLRSADYTASGASFYWAEFENVIWVFRSDWVDNNDTNTHGYGTTVDCQLPNPGVGKVWKHADFTSPYINPTSGRRTRNQAPTLNNGAAVKAGGSYGAVALLPAHGVMLVRANS